MKKLLSLLLIAPSALAGAQMDSHIAWIVPGPASAPTVTISPDGNWLAYISEDGVRLVAASTRTQRRFWPTQANGGRKVTLSFSPDSAYLYLLEDAANGVVSSYRTSSPYDRVNTARVFGAGTNPVKIVVFKDSFVGMMPSEEVINGVPNATLDIKSFKRDLSQVLRSRKLYHPNSLLPWRYSAGSSSTGDLVFFYNQSCDPVSGVVRKLDFKVSGVLHEPWTVGVDPQGGLIQQVVKPTATAYVNQGWRRVLGSVTWTKGVYPSGTDFYNGPMQFGTLPDGTGVGVMGSGDGKRVSALDWQTGDLAFTSDLGTGGRGFEFVEGMFRPGESAFYARYVSDANNQPKTAKFMLDANGNATQVADLSEFVGGFRQVQVAGGCVLALTRDSQLLAFNVNGSRRWASGSPGVRHFSEPSATGKILVATSTDLKVLSGTNGSTLATLAKKFKWVYWFGLNQFVAVDDSGVATLYSLSGSSFTSQWSVSGFRTAATVNPDFGYIAGITGNTLKVAWTTTKSVSTKTIPAGTRDGSRTLHVDEDGLRWLYDVGKTTGLARLPVGTSGVLGALSNGSAGWEYVSMDLVRYKKFAGKLYRSKSIRSTEYPRWNGLMSSKLAVSTAYIPESDDLVDAAISDDFLTAAMICGQARDGMRSDLTVARMTRFSGGLGSFGYDLRSGLKPTVTLSMPARKGGETLRFRASSLLPNPPDITVPEGQMTGTFDTVAYSDQDEAVNVQVFQLDPELPGFLYPVNISAVVSPASVSALPTDSNLRLVGGVDPLTFTFTRLGKSAVSNVLRLTSSAPSLLVAPAEVSMESTDTVDVPVTLAKVSKPTQVTLTFRLGNIDANQVGNTILSTKAIWIFPPYMKKLVVARAPELNGGTFDLTIQLNQRPLGVLSNGGKPIPVKLRLEWGSESKEMTVELKSISDTISIPTPLVSEPTNLKITGTTSGSEPAVVTVPLKPAVLSMYRLNSTTVIAGQKLTGTLKLNAPAGPNDVITLTSSSSRLTLPATIKVTPGSDVATFELATTAGAKTAVIITATLRGVTLKKTVTVTAG